MINTYPGSPYPTESLAASGNGQCQNAVRETQVTRELGNLISSVDRLEKFVVVLSERLKPVMSPEKQCDEKATCEPPLAPVAPVAEVVRGRSKHIDSLSRRLELMIGRIEV